MFKNKFLFRTEDEEFEALANPMHIQQVSAIVAMQHGVRMVEVADPETRKPFMVCVRDNTSKCNFTYLYPELKN